MRRQSDIREAERTGQGRRARDRLIGAQAPPPPRDLPADARARARDRMLLVADDLRESALAAAGIEAYLVRLHRLLETDATAGELAALAADDEIERRLAALDDALGALRRSLQWVAGRSRLADKTA